VPGWFGWRLGDSAPTLNGREVTALTWAGTRGVITLAAIFTVPTMLNDHRPFPDRDLLLLCAYMVVLVTLVGQGLTFGPLLRRLGLRINEAEAVQVRNDARLASIAAAREAVDDMQVEEGLPKSIADSLRSALGHRADRLRARISLLEESDADDGWTPELDMALRAQHRLIAAQREELVRWRDSGRLPDESLRLMQRELDHEERTLPGPPR
jgi:monovalent cation/hydrogen antiporter